MNATIPTTTYRTTPRAAAYLRERMEDYVTVDPGTLPHDMSAEERALCNLRDSLRSARGCLFLTADEAAWLAWFVSTDPLYDDHAGLAERDDPDADEDRAIVRNLDTLAARLPAPSMHLIGAPA